MRTFNACNVYSFFPKVIYTFISTNPPPPLHLQVQHNNIHTFTHAQIMEFVFKMVCIRWNIHAENSIHTAQSPLVTRNGSFSWASPQNPFFVLFFISEILWPSHSVSRRNFERKKEGTARFSSSSMQFVHAMLCDDAPPPSCCILSSSHLNSTGKRFGIAIQSAAQRFACIASQFAIIISHKHRLADDPRDPVFSLSGRVVVEKSADAATYCATSSLLRL